MALQKLANLKPAKLIVYLLSQLVLVAVLLELVGRWFDPLGISYYPEIAAYMDTLVIEEPIGYRNQPNLEGQFFGVTVSINAQGMRDKEIPSKPDNEFRILVMGDSVPFGIGVPVHDSFPAQLEHVLQSQAAAKVNIRTLNMGVPSYNTEQELTQLKQVGLSLNPDLAILLFSANDLQPKLWIFEKRKIWYVDWAQRSYAASLAYFAYTTFKSTLAQQKRVTKPIVSKLSAAPVGIQPHKSQWQNSPEWKSVQSALSEMNALLNRRGIPFALFTHNENQNNVNRLSRIGQTEGFPVLKLNSGADQRWSHYKPKQISNSAVDSHPNQLGNLIIATLIAERLTEMDLVMDTQPKER